MYDALSIGPLMVQIRWIALILSVLVGYVLIRVVYKQDKHKSLVIDKMWNALIIGIVVWKGSLFLLKPLATINNPMMLVYFSGGTFGVMLSLAVVALYFYMIARKHKLSLTRLLNGGGVALLGGVFMYELVAFIVQDLRDVLPFAVITLATLGPILYWFQQKRPDKAIWLQFIFYFSLGQIVTGYLLYGSFFSGMQWLYFALAIASVIVDYGKMKKFA